MASLALTFDLLARDMASDKITKVGNSAEKAGKQTDKFGAVTSKAMRSAGAAIAGVAVGQLFAGFIKDAAESARIGRLTGAVIESTGGAANVTAKQVGDLATAISNKTAVDDEAIQSGANLLLTFTNVRNEVGAGNDIFNQATQTITDMSVALGQDTKSSALQLGKALNDPIKGVTALQRVGVSFTESQREQIKTMVAAGDTLGAQKIILAELGKEFGGAAQAAADPIARLTVIAGNLGEEIGGEVLPIVNGLADVASDVLVPALSATVGIVSDTVGMFRDLPGPVQATIGALGAVVLLKGRLSSAFETIGLKALYARDAIKSSGSAMGAVKSAGSGLVGFLGGPWGLALTAGVGLVGTFISSLDEWGEASEEVKAGQEGITQALEESNGAINASVREAAAKAAQDAGLLDVAERLGISLPTVTDAVLGQRDALDQVNGVLDAAIGRSVGMEGALTQQGEATQRAKDALNQLAPTVANGRTAQEQLTDAVQGSAQAGGIFGDVLNRVGELAGETQENVKDLRDELAKLRGGSVDAAEAQINLSEQIRDAADATTDLDGAVTKANGKINLQTEAGAGAYRALVDVADASNDVIAAMRDQGKTAEQMAKRDGELRQSFIKTAEQMGIGRREARRLADQILGVPSDRRTTFNAETDRANRAIDNLQENIDNTTGKTITVQVRAAGRFIVNPNGGLQEFWKGGYTGAGGMYDVKGLVHGDEFVVPKRVVNRLGGPDAVAAAVGMGRDIGAPAYMTLVHDTRSIEDSLESLANAVDRATPKAGVAGSGAVGGAWQSIWNYVKARIPQARINSTYRPGDPGYHGRGKAIDFGFGTGPGGLGSAGLALINRTLHDGIGRNLAELIYDGIGDDRPDLKNGRPLTYNAATRAQHRNHVHAAVYDSGGWLRPGLTLAYNGTGRDERVLTAGQAGPRTVNNIYTYDNAAAIERVLAAQAHRQDVLSSPW